MVKVVKKVKSQLAKFGMWFFIFGTVFALIAGFFVGITQLGVQILTAIPGWLASILVLMGLAIGFVNITRKESLGFIVSVIGLAVVSGILSWTLPVIGGLLGVIKAMATTLLYVAAPAAIVVIFASLIRYTRK